MARRRRTDAARMGIDLRAAFATSSRMPLALFVFALAMMNLAATDVLAFDDVRFDDAERSSNSAAASETSDKPLAKAHAATDDDRFRGDHSGGWQPPRDGGDGPGGPRGRWRPGNGEAPSESDQVAGSSSEGGELLPPICEYYARRAFGCSRPRTCHDCVKMKGCMINQFGRCVNMTKHGFEPDMDYHKVYELNATGNVSLSTNSALTQRYHFASSNTTYCESTDAQCSACAKTAFAGEVSDSRFCIGANGCVCIASCEVSTWESLVGGISCGPPPRPRAFAAKDPPPMHGEEESSGVNWRDVWMMGGIPAFVVVVGMIVIRSQRLETKRREEAAQLANLQAAVESDGDAPAAAAAPAGRNRLNLFGWQSMRNQLIKKENLLLSGEEDVQPPHKFVNMLQTQPSAPDAEVHEFLGPVERATMVEASAPAMSPPQDGLLSVYLKPTAPSFDSEMDFTSDERDLV